MSKPTASHRAKSHDALLKEALARPGVREYMEVYHNWRDTDSESAETSESADIDASDLPDA